MGWFAQRLFSMPSGGEEWRHIEGWLPDPWPWRCQRMAAGFFLKNFPWGTHNLYCIGIIWDHHWWMDWEYHENYAPLKVGNMHIYIYIYFTESDVRLSLAKTRNILFRLFKKVGRLQDLCSLFYWLNYNISLTIWLLLKIVPRVLFPSFSPVTKQTASKHWSSLRWATSDVSWYVKPSSYRYLPLPTM